MAGQSLDLSEQSPKDVADELSPEMNGVKAPEGDASPGENGSKDGETGAGDTAQGEDAKEEVRAAPQAAEPASERPSTSENEGEMFDCKLSPLDVQNQKQNLKDVLAGKAPPPLPEERNGVDGRDDEPATGSPPEQQSSLHQDEYAQYGEQKHHPRNHESALGSSAVAPATKGTGRFKKPFVRKKQPLSKGGHSNPRKSPYRSEVGKLRHGGAPPVAPGGATDDASNASSGSRTLGIKDTTAPPESASFALQSSKFKHSLLNSLGEFLTSAFADDEEASGSYFSQDLLDQLGESNPRLKGVWLQAKGLTDDHVRQLCDALIRNKVVTEVWLPSNKITDVGAGHIAHMLKFNRSIRELFLGQNDIGPRGAASLAGALARGNSTLVALGLGDNHIGVEGAGAFAAALRHNHALHTLDVKNNGVPRGSSIRGLLNKMLEFNSSDPGDESLVLGLQEELANLVSGLPSDAAEEVVQKAEEALKEAMLCRKRGDRIGAAEAEGVFIRICTTGEAPVDPDGEMAEMVGKGMAVRRERPKGDQPMDPDETEAEEHRPSTIDEEGEEEEEEEEEEAAKGDGEGEDEDEKKEEGGQDEKPEEKPEAAADETDAGNGEENAKESADESPEEVKE